METGIAERARRELRQHYEGTLLFKGLVCHVRYILEGRSGRLLMPVEPAAAEGDAEGGAVGGELTLLVPDERENAAQALLRTSLADERGDAGEWCDRWTAYHGGSQRAGLGPMRSVWVWGEIEAVKLEGGVCSGDEVGRPNPLRAVEPRLCRELNAQREAVAALCRRQTGLAVETPLVVGVDDEGFDVRARFGIVRLEFGAAVRSAEEAHEAIRRMLATDAGA